MTEKQDYHSVYKIKEKDDNYLLTDIIEIHLIDMKRFREHGKIDNDKLEKWLQFIEDPNVEESDSMALIDCDIGKAKEILSILSCDDDVKALAEMRKKALMDEKSRINSSVKKNVLDKAVNLLSMIDDESISIATGLSPNVIKKLRRNN